MRITLAASDLFNQIAPWLVALVVFAMVGGLIISAARGYLTNKSSDISSSGFTLADLRRLNERGEIDQAQYERAKAALMNSPEMAGPMSEKSSDKSTTKAQQKQPFQSPPKPPAK
ncbi:MAG: SHOCT domain-containing protein [Phycisphaerales bacterium]|nr:SHOCT domain-containing protein [Phycisphaerales bacterium]